MSPEEWKYRLSILRHPFSVSVVFYRIEDIEEFLYQIIPTEDFIDYELVMEIYNIKTDSHGWFSSSIQYSRYNRFHHINNWVQRFLDIVEESKFRLRYSNGTV